MAEAQRPVKKFGVAERTVRGELVSLASSVQVPLTPRLFLSWAARNSSRVLVRSQDWKSPIDGAVFAFVPGGGRIEDVARRGVGERRTHRVAEKSLSTHDPKIRATDPDASVGRAPNEQGPGYQEQCERSATGGDQREAQVRIVRVDDVDRDVEAVQWIGRGGGNTRNRDRESRVPVPMAMIPSVWLAERVIGAGGDRVGHDLLGIVTEVVKGDRDLAGGDPRIS